MRVKVRALGNLRLYLPDAAETLVLEVGAGTTIDDLLQRLAVPDEGLWLVNVNGKRVKGDYLVEEGDEVLLVAPVGGG